MSGKWSYPRRGVSVIALVVMVLALSPWGSLPVVASSSGLTVTLEDRSGNPSQGWVAAFEAGYPTEGGPGPTVNLTVPDGTYTVMATIQGSLVVLHNVTAPSTIVIQPTPMNTVSYTVSTADSHGPVPMDEIHLGLYDGQYTVVGGAVTQAAIPYPGAVFNGYATPLTYDRVEAWDRYLGYLLVQDSVAIDSGTSLQFDASTMPIGHITIDSASCAWRGVGLRYGNDSEGPVMQIPSGGLTLTLSAGTYETDAWGTITVVAEQTQSRTVACSTSPNPTGSITAHSFRDTNQNQQQDSGEPNLTGWTMTLYQGMGCVGPVLGTGATDSSGNVTFGSLESVNLQEYSVREDVQPSWTATTRSCQNVTLDGQGAAQTVSFGDVPSVVTSFTPNPSSNGRAIAYDDPGHLYYTNDGDTHIYEIDTSGGRVAACDVGVQIGALSWDPIRGELWAGSYDGSGKVYLVAFGARRGSKPNGKAFEVCTKKYQFTFIDDTNPDTSSGKYIDGLAYDPYDDTLWLSSDTAVRVFHRHVDGSVIADWQTAFQNSGITVQGDYLWIGNPEYPSSSVVQFTKSGSSTGKVISAPSGVEGLAVQSSYATVSASAGCVLWSHSASGPITAYTLGSPGDCPYTTPSYNFAGYQVQGKAGYSSVTGSWVVPTVICPDVAVGRPRAAFWVGLGSQAIEQMGVTIQCSPSGTPGKPYAWLETLGTFPGTPECLGLSPWESFLESLSSGCRSSQYPVAAGDHIQAAVHYKGNGQYEFTMTDSTQNWTFDQPRTGPGDNTPRGRDSAEWIVESASPTYVLPGVGFPGPLAEFDEVQFSNATADGQPITADTNVKRWTLAVPDQGIVKAESSTISTNGTQFTVVWWHQ